jgi:hypothetical protein
MKPLKYGINKVPGSGSIEVLRNSSTPTGRMFKILLPGQNDESLPLPEQESGLLSDDLDENSYFENKKNALYSFIQGFNPKNYDEETKARLKWRKDNEENQELQKRLEDLNAKTQEKDDILDNFKKAANLEDSNFVTAADSEYYDSNPEQKRMREQIIKLFPEYEQVEKEDLDLVRKHDILSGKFKFKDSFESPWEIMEKKAKKSRE